MANLPNGANLGFESELWRAADALRSNMDAAKYKHVVLGLIFLKYISDAFEEQHAKLEGERKQGADPEDADEYRAVNIFWVPTQIPVCLWFIARDKKNGRFRDRRGQTLFIDARKLGTMIDRVHRELTEEEIHKIAHTYHGWRGDKNCKKKYKDDAGFCNCATQDDIRQYGHILTPGR